MGPLKFSELEQIYDELAEAIDASGPGRESVFLAKLALALAHEFGNAARVSELIKDCLDESAAQRPTAEPLI